MEKSDESIGNSAAGEPTRYYIHHSVKVTLLLASTKGILRDEDKDC